MQKTTDGLHSDQCDKLLEGLPIGIERIDSEGNILYSNAAHHRMLGYNDGELIGRNIVDLSAEPENSQQLKEYLAHLVEHQPEPEPWIALNRRKDGSTFEIRVDWDYERDEHGRAVGFFAALSDISAQREAEKQRDQTLADLQINRSHTASLMESAVNFVLYRLAAIPGEPFAGKVVLVSPSIRKIMGVDDPQDFSTWFANIHPEDRERIVEANQVSAQTGGPFDEVMRINHPYKDELRYIRAISRPILDEQGTPQFFNGLIMDITAERRAQQEKRQMHLKLQQRQRLESLGTLTGGIAHDFNNLLVGMLGSSDLALKLLPEGTEARQQIHNVVTAAQRAAELTNQLLAYSGRGVIEFTVTSLNEILEEMAAILQPAISKKARLQLDLKADLPAVKVDTSQIRQVIMNLITNASDALTGEAGTIRIATAASDIDSALVTKHGLPTSFQGRRFVELTVADTGCGMDEQTVSRIFDPFFTTKGHGRGLGLAAVRGIIQGHRGDIHVASEPGKGTLFSVLIPIAEPDESVDVASNETSEEFGDVRRTVLVIDDEKLVRDVAEQMLETNGHDVMTAANGMVGAETFASHAQEIDVILLDMNMPKMSGVETFEALRKIRPDIPVVFSTGYHEQEFGSLLDKQSGVDFIQKPYQVEQLLAKLRCGRR